MPLLVTSAAGANGNGYGTLLAFDLNGRPLGAFSGDSRIADPRGLPSIGTKGCSFSTAAPAGCWRSTRMGGSFVTAARLKG